MNTFKQAVELIAAHGKYVEENRNEQIALQAEFEVALLAAWKATKTKKKYTREKAMVQFPEIFKEFQTRANHMIEERREIADTYKVDLHELAQTAVIPVTKEKHKVEWIYGGAYRSQGYSAEKYSHAAAQQFVDMAAAHKVPAEIKCEEYESHTVWANCTPAAWSVLKEKEGTISLRDWIKNCYARGLNPRVFNPFLPHGIEEKLGLDHFGGEIK